MNKPNEPPPESRAVASRGLTPESFAHYKGTAEMLAQGGITVPKHFRNNPRACFAVLLQSMQWGMNPVPVFQKTHITQGRIRGYEAQQIAAVVIKNAPIKGWRENEFIGDWSKILGKCEERKSEKSGGKYYVATYTEKDEEGLSVIVLATFIDEDQSRELTAMMAQAWPPFSTQWATDPQQQIGYLAMRKWARRFAPEVILGAYTPEEIASRRYDMGAAAEVPLDERNTDTSPVSGNVGFKRRMRSKPKIELSAAAGLAERLKSDANNQVARTAFDDRHEGSRAAARAAKDGGQLKSEPESESEPITQDDSCRAEGWRAHKLPRGSRATRTSRGSRRSGYRRGSDSLRRAAVPGRVAHAIRSDGGEVRRRRVMRIFDLRRSPRIVNELRMTNILDTSDLVCLKADDLPGFAPFGKHAVAEIQRELERLGLRLRPGETQ